MSVRHTRVVGGILPPAPATGVRALAFAAVSVAFAVAAHTSTDRTAPDALVVAAAFVGVLATARPLAALEHRVGALFTALLGIQLGLHAVFQWTATGRTGGTAAGWLCCGDPGAVPPSVATGPPGMGQSLDRAALVQLAVHLVAAVVLAAWLRRCERSLWRHARLATARAVQLLHGLALLLGSPRSPVPAPAAPRWTAETAAPPRPRRRLWVDVRALRRGPPPAALPV